MKSFIRTSNMKTQRGVTLIMVTIALVALIGFAALAIDISNLYVARNELQNAADAGALAGARCLYRYAYKNITTGIEYQYEECYDDNEALNNNERWHYTARINEGANQKALNAAQANLSQKATVEVNQQLGENQQLGDIQRGHWGNSGFQDNSSTAEVDLWYFHPDSEESYINAIRVKTRREATPVNTFFSRIFGIANFQLQAQAVALIGALESGEANLPIAVCRDEIIYGDEGKCNRARKFNNEATQFNAGRWTNFAQRTFTATDIESLLTKGCDHVNPVTIAPGSLIGTTTSIGDIDQKIMDCWKNATAEKITIDGKLIETYTKPWEVILPVIDCSEEKNGFSPVIGRAKFEILWIIGPDDTIEDAPYKMTDDLTGNPWDGTTLGEGGNRWNDFVQHFGLYETNGIDFARFEQNSIYFRPRSCFIFSNPVLVK